MSLFNLKANFLAALIASALFVPASAQQNPTPPDFSSNLTGWVGFNGAGPFFEAAPGRVPGPVTSDPAHPFVPNGTGKQPTFRIADLSNPNLMPWVKERMQKDNDEVLAGKAGYTAQSSCMPGGVPMFMGMGGPNSLIFLQTPKEVWMMIQSDQQVRRIYMNVPHSKNPKPSWYGESVGHYEGDTLVVDTIGLNDRSYADIYRTPHTEKLHVVERWRMVDNGQTLESVFTLEDPGAFYQPWTAMRRYRRAQQEPDEIICSENNYANLFDYNVPKADKPDF